MSQGVSKRVSERVSERVSKRTFGVEIECGHPHNSCESMPYLLKQGGFPARIGSSTKKQYGVGHDGSGIEIKTPILKGKGGYEELTKILDYLFELGCYVTRRDGMHVHIGAEELCDDNRAVRTLARTWYNNQKVITRMCSSHRYNAYYCRAVNLKGISNLGDPYPNPYYNAYVTFNGELYGKHWGPRAQGLNFNSLPEHGTVEFRLHEGCLDATKAVSWVKFCQAFVDYAVTEKKEIATCASKTALLNAVGVPEDARAVLWPRQPQMPPGYTKKIRRRRAKK